MLLQKEFGFVGDCVNKNSLAPWFFSIGIIGACIILYGLTQTIVPQIYYVVGASFLLMTAIYFQLTYFVALELILIAGHGAILLGIGPVLQAVLPILLSIQFLAYYILSGRLESIFRVIGITGIALLSIAFAYTNPWLFLYGSLGVGIFAFYQVYQGYRAALLWGIFNIVYISIATYKLIF
jgi:hypothetical protein